jgi:hypothetical protein
MKFMGAGIDTAKRVIRVQQWQDRFNERIRIGAKSSIDRKVSGKDTAGSWSMFEAHHDRLQQLFVDLMTQPIRRAEGVHDAECGTRRSLNLAC